MQVPYNDRWERTKRYLLRNFLVNPGFHLSPIPEERSSPDSGSLPDLIVEPAPDRHDEPPDFYEDLERRMKRYYRKLFLDANGSDDESSDFEVNRSMASTFMLETDGRKEKRDFEADEDFTRDIRFKKTTHGSLEVDASDNEDYYDDKLIDTGATYNDTRHVSVDSKSLSIRDEESLELIELHAVNESNHINKSGDGRNDYLETYGIRSYEDIDDQPNESLTIGGVKKSGALNDTKDTTPDSEEVPCHRMSTTVAEIHERRERGSTQVLDSGSPVLIPRLLQFSKSVFGSKSGQSFNVSEASDEFIRRLSSYNSDASNKHNKNAEAPETEIQRLLSPSELTRASIDLEKTLDKEKIVEYVDTDENNSQDDTRNDNNEMQENKTQTENEDSTIETDNETETTDIRNASVDWNKDGIDDDEDCFDNAVRRGEFARKARRMIFISSSESFDDLEPIAQSSAKSDEVEEMREARGNEGNERCSWPGEVDQDSPALAFETQRDADKLESESSNATEINASFEEVSGQQDSSNASCEEEAEVSEDSHVSNQSSALEEENLTASGVRLDPTQLSTSSEKGMQEASTDPQDSNELDACQEEIEEVIENPHDVTPRVSSAEEMETNAEQIAEASEDLDSNKLRASSGQASNVTDDSIEISALEPDMDEANTHNNQYTKIIDDFWSVSSIEIDIEESPKDRRSKRRIDSGGDAPPIKRKKDIAIQTCPEVNYNNWEHVRSEFFVGTPVVFRLCGCQDHVCS